MPTVVDSADLLRHVTADKAPLYRSVMDVFAAAKRQYRLQLRPDEVLSEANGLRACRASKKSMRSWRNWRNGATLNPSRIRRVSHHSEISIGRASCIDCPMVVKP